MPLSRVEMGNSGLLDMRDCESESFREIGKEMSKIKHDSQPKWLEPLLELIHQERPLLFDLWHTRQWEYPWAVLSADLRPGMRVLDAGCGGSPFPVYLARRGLHCWGIEPGGQESIHELGPYRFVRRRLLRLMGVNFGGGYYELNKRFKVPITYEQVSIERMSFENGFFDRVFCLSVMEHIPRSQWRVCVEQLLRVLRPGGKLAITMDMGPEDTHCYENIIRYSGASLLRQIDHSIPPSTRHPDWDWETVGIVITKE